MKLIGAGLSVLMLCTSIALAATEAPRQATVVGQVVSIDPAANSVVVKVEDRRESGELTLVVSDDSKIVKSGKAATLHDLTPGEKVTVSYRVENGQNIVISLGVVSKD